jgi:hypothetical protein
MTHLATVVAAFTKISYQLLRIFAAFSVILELNLDFLSANSGLIISI